MFRSRSFLLLAAAIVGIAVVGAPSRARAGFELKISTASLGLIATIVDGGAGDTRSETGAIGYNGSAGLFQITVSTAVGMPAIGSKESPEMHLDILVSTWGPSFITDSITITASQNDYGPVVAPANFAMAIGGVATLQKSLTTGAVAVQYTAGQDPNDALFAMPNATTLDPVIDPMNGIFSAAGTLVGTAANPYSLTQTVTFTYTNAKGTSSQNATLTAVPAPAGLLLGLSAAPFLGLGAWLRGRRTRVNVA